jgi:hypothetical protein
MIQNIKYDALSPFPIGKEIRHFITHQVFQWTYEL